MAKEISIQGTITGRVNVLVEVSDGKFAELKDACRNDGQKLSRLLLELVDYGDIELSSEPGDGLSFITER